ncbi:MAG: TIGR03960 family B12-binding radical SAM protein [bacterium]
MAHIYQEILDSIQKPVRYLGNEWNVIRKSKEEARKRVVLCFPDTYEIGMSHLGLRILYAILNKRDDTAAERCYTPWIDMEQKLRQKGWPLVSLETQTPLNEFDVVGFSLQYELEYTNILTMLDLGGIPLHSRERAAKDPLVIGGGPCAFSPEPIVDYFDCILIGDGEEAFPNVVDRFIELRDGDLPRAEILGHLAQCDGIYVPSLYETRIDSETGFEVVTGSTNAPYPVRRTYIEDINQYPFPADILVPHGDIVHDRVSVEIARGCTEGCRFCQAGTIYRPVRERKPEEIIKSVLKSLAKTGFDQASLTSLSTADFSCIGPLAQKLSDELQKRKTAMTVSSMRVYGMTDDLGVSLSKVRRSGFTIAPEAGSQRMRDVINKGITEEVILHGARTAFQNGWNHVKLYFMIGLPTETGDDLKAIVDLGVKILRLAEQEHGKKAQVTISISSHIPKPHAPFQWLGVEDQASLREKQKYLLRLIRPHKRLRLKWHDVEHTWLEAIFSRGDRRLNKAVELAYRRGCRFDAWTDQVDVGAWRQVFDDLNIDTEIWMRDIPLYAALPWDHLDSLVKKEWLVRELKRAMKGRFSPACEKPFKRKDEHDRTDLGRPTESDKLVCYHCGLECDLDAIRRERIESWRSLENGIEVKGEVPQEGESSPYPQRVTRYRAAYTKLGECRFLSALDSTRTFTRAFNRSMVPLRFSQGFHPAPVISFGPALAVGMESAEEFLDFETVADIPEQELRARLNAQLPRGLEFTALAKIDARAKSLFEVIDFAEYSVLVDLAGLEEYLETRANGRAHATSVALHAAFANKLLERDSIEVKRTSKGRLRIQDVRPLIRKLEVLNSEVPLRLRLLLGSGRNGSVRPEIVLKEMYGEDVPLEMFRIRRERLLVEKAGTFYSPLELD